MQVLLAAKDVGIGGTAVAIAVPSKAQTGWAVFPTSAVVVFYSQVLVGRGTR